MAELECSTATKKCTKCGAEKAAMLENFGIQKGGRFGLKAVCRPCARLVDYFEVECPGCHHQRLVRLSDWKKRKSDYCHSCMVRVRVGLAPDGSPSHKGTRLHNIWRGLRQRCGYIDGAHEHDRLAYAERGIDVYEAWRDAFQPFFEWAMSHEYDENLVLDRRDNDQGYCPDNCRWITVTESNRNKRTTLSIEVRKAILTACAHGASQRSQAVIYGIEESTVSNLVSGKTYA